MSVVGATPLPTRPYINLQPIVGPGWVPSDEFMRMMRETSRAFNDVMAYYDTTFRASLPAVHASTHAYGGSDYVAPSGPAGGHLAGSYPSPTLVDGSSVQKIQVKNGVYAVQGTRQAIIFPDSDYISWVLSDSLSGVSAQPNLLDIPESKVTGLVTDLASKSSIVPVTVDTVAATAAKTATVSGYTRRVGDILAVKFTLGNTVASMTLNLTDDTGALGAASILFNASATNTATATLTANSVVMLYWDGTSYHMLGSQRTSDSDTYDQVRWSGGAKNGAAPLYSYKLCGMDSGGLVYPFTLESGTGTNKTVSSQQFLLDGPILGYGSTTTVSAGSTSVYFFSERNFDIRYTSNRTFTAWLPIYLKVTLVDERTYQLAGAGTVGGTSFLTQSLPTSDDGCLYILLGYMHTTYGMLLVGAHPIYEYKNGGVRLYTPASVLNNAPTISSGTAAPTSTPSKVGDIFVDTTNKKLYFATGTSSSSDWTIAN